MQELKKASFELLLWPSAFLLWRKILPVGDNAGGMAELLCRRGCWWLARCTGWGSLGEGLAQSAEADYMAPATH
jgi:hypothetical protein